MTFRPSDLLIAGLIAGACTAILGWFAAGMLGVL